MKPAIILLAFVCLRAQDPAEILGKVAANLEQATAARREYIYEQKVRARLIRSNGELGREEKRYYTAVPKEAETEKKLDSFEGQYRHHKTKKLTAYSEPGFKQKDMDIDAELLDDLINDLVNAPKSRDGIPNRLFPLRAQDLPHYKLTSLGQTEHRGRAAHRVGFEPAKKTWCLEIGADSEGCELPPWKGEALVDAAEHQPIHIQTQLAFGIPWAVKAFLGTNLRQTGFSVTYERVAPGVWFPVTYGTEFELKVLFGYKRTITLAMDNSRFRKASAESKIEFAPFVE